MNKKVTITTVANEAGVSIAAVSRAFDKNSNLKPEKRALILETAKRLGYAPNKMAARLPCKPIQIGVLVYGTIESYYNEYLRGIKASHENFAAYKVDCDLRVLKKTQHSVEEAYRVIDEFADNGYDGVILSGFNNSSDVARINRLAEKNIPFIMLGHDITDCQRSGVSMNNVAAAGRLAAQLLSAAMGFENRQVAVLYSDFSILSQKLLVKSFCDSAEENGFEIYKALPTYDVYDNAYAATEKLLGDTQIGGIYVSTANSIAVCDCVTRMGLKGKIALITSDIFPRLNAYIEDGTVFASIYQNPFRQAKTAFDSLIYSILEREKIEEFSLISPIAVFKSNLSLYKN